MAKTQPKSLDKKDRRQVANQLMNLAHIAIGFLLFSQALSGKPFSLPAAIAGMVVFAVAYYWAINLMQGGDNE